MNQKLTKTQLAKARLLARTDYEVRHLLRSYERGSLDEDGFDWLLEELS